MASKNPKREPMAIKPIPDSFENVVRTLLQPKRKPKYGEGGLDGALCPFWPRRPSRPDATAGGGDVRAHPQATRRASRLGMVNL